MIFPYGMKPGRSSYKGKGIGFVAFSTFHTTLQFTVGACQVASCG